MLLEQSKINWENSKWGGFGKTEKHVVRRILENYES